MPSAVTLAKRAFVKVLLAVARAYSVTLQLNRDSEDEAVRKAYKKVCLKFVAVGPRSVPSL